MVQAEILEFLENNPGKLYNARQISEAIGTNFYKICKGLAQLIKYKEIEWVEYDRLKAAKVLKSKKITRRMRFFYVEESVETSEGTG